MRQVTRCRTAGGSFSSELMDVEWADHTKELRLKPQEGAPDPRDIAEQLVDLFVRNLAVAITYGPVADAIKAAWIKTRQEWRAK